MNICTVTQTSVRVGSVCGR